MLYSKIADKIVSKGPAANADNLQAAERDKKAKNEHNDLQVILEENRE